ncbi:MAG: hypothetical protein WD556_11425 [Actinomycetota bacterium]
MGTLDTSFDAWIGATSVGTTFDAEISKPRSLATTFDAYLSRQLATTFDTLIVNPDGTFRGVVADSVERDAIEGLQPSDKVSVVDVDEEQFHRGAGVWVGSARLQTPEAGVVQTLGAILEGGWRVELGDPSYPLRYWDGASDEGLRLTDSGALEIIRDGAGEQVMRVRQAADSSNRLTIAADGEIRWGSGSASTDVSLSRPAANELQLGTDDVLTLQERASAVTSTNNKAKLYAKEHTDGKTYLYYRSGATVGDVEVGPLVGLAGLIAATASHIHDGDILGEGGGNLSPQSVIIEGATTSTEVLRTWVTGDADFRLEVLSTGEMAWGDGTGTFDVGLSRAAANVLALGTDDALEFEERASDIGTPATGKWRLYAKAAGVFVIDDAGAVIGPLGTGGGSLTDHTHAATGSGANGGGATLAPTVLTLPTAATPAITAEGRIEWDTNDDLLAIGDGAATRLFGPLDRGNTWTAQQLAERSSGGQGAWAARIAGDTNNRVSITAGGAVKFGSGSAAVDTSMSRGVTTGGTPDPFFSFEQTPIGFSTGGGLVQAPVTGDVVLVGEEDPLGLATVFMQRENGQNAELGFNGLESLTSPVTSHTTTGEAVLIRNQLPAGFLRQSTTLRIRAHGVIGTKAAPVGTSTWRCRIGPTTLTGNIVTTVAPALAASQTNQGWSIEFDVTVRSAGASGTLIGNGGLLTEAIAISIPSLSRTETTATVVVDTTVSNWFELTFQWGTSNASNTITVHNASIEVVLL